jgi:hypothetical protein
MFKITSHHSSLRTSLLRGSSLTLEARNWCKFLRRRKLLFLNYILFRGIIAVYFHCKNHDINSLCWQTVEVFIVQAACACNKYCFSGSNLSRKQGDTRNLFNSRWRPVTIKWPVIFRSLYSVYCLYVDVYCTVLLPGVNPIAVKNT